VREVNVALSPFCHPGHDLSHVSTQAHAYLLLVIQHSGPWCRALRQEVAAYQSLHQGLLSSAVSRRGTRDTVASGSTAGLHHGGTPLALDIRRQQSTSSAKAAAADGPGLQEGLLAVEGAGGPGVEETQGSKKDKDNESSHQDGLDELLKDASEPVRIAVLLLQARYVQRCSLNCCACAVIVPSQHVGHLVTYALPACK
jgi:hypothetical protein